MTVLRNPAHRVLILNTVSFAICFAAWTLYAVLITYLDDHRVIRLDRAEIGWLIGAPVLTGALLRLPMGMLADRLGSKAVFISILLFSGIAMYLTSFASTFLTLLVGGLAFGVAGSAFPVSVAHIAAWFPKERQGTALGLFGLGTTGTAVTAMGAPPLLRATTGNGQYLEGWKLVPQIYAGALLVTAVLFWALAPRNEPESAGKPVAEMLKPLRNLRVWRFGLYYFVTFGAFVSLSQWLIPYYLNVYGTSLVAAGLLATVFSLPSGITRAVGGLLSDRIGARRTLYLSLFASSAMLLLLVIPKMEIIAPGEGVMAETAGVVKSVTDKEIVVGDVTYSLRRSESRGMSDRRILPGFASRQEPQVKPGDQVGKRQILARGITHVSFQADQGVFTFLLFVAGIAMGLGSAAVYKHIPDYFPNDVGVVGGLVGVLGGLGGFILPIVFGYLLRGTGLWTSCWLLLGLTTISATIWMHSAVVRIVKEERKPAGYGYSYVAHSGT